MGFTWLIQNGVFGEKLAQATDTKQLGFAFLGYLIFTVFMTVGAMETHKVLFTIFVLVNSILKLIIPALQIRKESDSMLALITGCFF